MDTLFAWIHLSDLQIGHGRAAEAAVRQLVLAALRRDIAALILRERLQIDAVIVTGDIAWAGRAEQYEDARTWLGEVAGAVGADMSRVYVVPGNHDVDRDPAVPDRDAARLVRALREGHERLDEALTHERDHLIRRQKPYLNFAASLAPKCRDLFWVDHIGGRDGLRVRLVGLNTALLSDGKDDHGRLQVGTKRIQEALVEKEGELIVVLSHHPFSDGWLADQVDADRWIRSRAHMHMFGHVKDAYSQRARTGAGGDFVRIAARAAHRNAGEPADHGYSIGAVVHGEDGSLAVRLWPRRWSDQNKDFRDDVGHVPEGAKHVQHPLRFCLAGARPPVRAAVAGPEVSIARIPFTNSELFGRDADLAWLDSCWEDGVHVASIVAWGGVGKTALVTKWLTTRMRDKGWRGAERVYFRSFYSQGPDRSSADEYIDAALRCFGDADPTKGSPWDKGERLATLVKRKRTILILDGVEALQWGPGVEAGKFKDPSLRTLVQALGMRNNGLCLVTSRIGMADLEALAGDKVREKNLAHLSPQAGAELLKARGASGPDEDLAEAAREYEGHSFALTLLGEYLRKAHKGDIRRRDMIPPLTGKPAQRMMATYERWFQDKPELAILRMLGLFNRPAPEDEIAMLQAPPEILGLTDMLHGLTQSAWNEAVTALRDVGLLAPGLDMAEPDRLDVHPLLHEHFSEQLRQQEPEAWREGHRRLYEYLKMKAKERPDTIEEMAPLYAAVVHGCLAGKVREALNEVFFERISRRGEFFSTRKLGAFNSDIAALSAFFEVRWERFAPGLSEADQAFVLSVAARAFRALGRLPEAAGLLRQGLERHLAQKDWENAAEDIFSLSGLLKVRGQLSEALAHAQRSLALASDAELSVAESVPQMALERVAAQASTAWTRTPGLLAPISRGADSSLRTLLASIVRGSTGDLPASRLRSRTRNSANAEDWERTAKDAFSAPDSGSVDWETAARSAFRMADSENADWEIIAKGAFNENEVPVDMLASMKGYGTIVVDDTGRELSEPLTQERKYVELADENGGSPVRIIMMTTVAAILHAKGLWVEATEHFEEAERTQEDTEPAYPSLYGVPGFQYCDLLLDWGRDAEVRERAAKRLAEGQNRDTQLESALDHLSLGRSHLLAAQRCGRSHLLAAQRCAVGELAQAANHLQQALDGLRLAGEQEYLPLGLLARAELHTHTHAYDEARRDLHESLTLATRCGFRLHLADTYLGSARLHLAEAELDQARSHLARAGALIDATGYHRRDYDLARLESEAACSSFKLKARLFLRCRRKGAGQP